MRNPARRHAVNAIAVHVDNLEPVVTALEHVAGPWHAAQSEHSQPAERVIVLPIFLAEQRLRVERPQDGVEIERTVKEPAAVLATDNRGFLAGC